ncbi:MAG: cysteine--tRNA ligase [Elusimicrobia bacterium CG08_land_8_20_14_0_20_44_26]|nr:MAG: cysteine--tRNA ligase [Elusimicrobia bacterium CG08_land_8_20_14_0_20_44_26]
MRKIYFYNTLTKKKQEFIPLKKGKVGMYVCGITPYDYTHLGHARCYVVFDAIRRFMERCGYSVKYVQNFTDIDDKIIERGLLKNKDFAELSGEFIEEYYNDIRRIGVRDADIYPRVSGHIPDIINAVKKLQEKGYAYEISGSVYFRVSAFEAYGALSGRNPEDLKPGSRVEVDVQKERPLDFALWKKSKENEPGWVSPWGRGRPGWHIECSVMSTKYIGETLDIHAGGQDLIFPHHENEVAQSVALTGKMFSRFFLHNGFVTINKEKMSKSLNNFFTLRDIYKKFSPQSVRFFLLSQHYRSPIDFSEEALEDAERSLERINRVFEEKISDEKNEPAESEAGKIYESFMDDLSDDFNTSAAFSKFFALVKLFNQTKSAAILRKIEDMDKILGFLKLEKKEKKLLISEEEIKRLIKKRAESRNARDYASADRIRVELLEKGVILEDTPSGVKWRLR